MGMTEVRPYFKQIIGHNSMKFHQIPTNLGTEIHFIELLKCTKVQPDWITHLHFMVDFAKCAK